MRDPGAMRSAACPRPRQVERPMKSTRLDDPSMTPAALRVLVIDDSRDGAAALGMQLEHMGCDVRLSDSGESAVDFAPRFCPQLVILDLSMPPGIDGYETACQLKKQAWSDSASFVAHSASGDPLVAEAVARAGFRFYVSKPAAAGAFETI